MVSGLSLCIFWLSFLLLWLHGYSGSSSIVARHSTCSQGRKRKMLSWMLQQIFQDYFSLCHMPIPGPITGVRKRSDVRIGLSLGHVLNSRVYCKVSFSHTAWPEGERGEECWYPKDTEALFLGQETTRKGVTKIFS